MNLSSSSSSSLTFHLTNQTFFKPPQRKTAFNKRRRIKQNPKLTVLNLIDPSLELLTPAIGFFTGAAAIFFSSKLSPKLNPSSSRTSTCGEWVLFTSPTPFNRFVILRCPSIEGNVVNDRLVKEERHFVSGRIHAEEDSDFGDLEDELKYQRVCVSTEDGGVISLDWPANLKLKEEHGLDSTMLLVPGTAEGSMGKDVRLFVCEALVRGFFPIVMNPRGCAGSPLTTARLFTAADSDDIATAIQFISKARPWTTLMGVGWGYGANMLTKYLSEAGERTPLTAATCIDNPFDLEEAARSSPHHVALDTKLSGGLIGILRSNKELFQGREKGFDVESALLAKSVRDFEKAISMVSYGFDAIEDFYSESSTRNLVENVKIPVLFIQNDDGIGPLLSVPRSSIAQNPYTSLLLCSCTPSSMIRSGRTAASWCQHLTIEWLTAVELGLLKGRHPLLEDVDVTINPLNVFDLSEGTEPPTSNEKNNKLLDLKLSNDSNNYSIDPLNEVLEDNNTVTGIHLRSGEDSVRKLEDEVQGSQGVDNVLLQHTSSTDTELVEKDEVVAQDSENGQVLQTAQVVMNMLDVTMPGTLSEEKKKKVLTSVTRGETLMKALEMAVPEEVRGKLTTSVAGILNAQHTNLNFGRLMGIGKIPDHQTAESKIPDHQEKDREQSNNNESLSKDPNSSDRTKRSDDLADGSDDVASDTDRPPSEPHLSENPQSSPNTVQSHSSQHDVSSSHKKDTNEPGNNLENDEMLKEKVLPHSDVVEKGTETSAKPNTTAPAEKLDGTGEVEERKADQDGGVTPLETKEENNIPKNEEKLKDSSNDQSKVNSPDVAASSQGSSVESHPIESVGNDNQRIENKNPLPLVDQINPVVPGSNPPAFNVTQAFNALTGMDDSTQLAVSSVFGVLENMITQFEENENGENEVDGRHEVAEEEINTASQKQSQTGARTGSMEQGHGQNPISYEESGTDGSHERSTSDQLGVNSKRKDRLVGDEILAKYSNKPTRVNNIPLYVVANSYREFMHKDHFRRYLVSKVPYTKPLDQDSTAALLLDYFPEDGQWKLLEQPDGIEEEVEPNSPAKGYDIADFIEPSYVILDGENEPEAVRDNEASNVYESAKNDEDRSNKLVHFVKLVVSDCLRIEVDRKLDAFKKRKFESDLSKDIERVAIAVSLAVRSNEEHSWCLKGNDSSTEKISTLHGGKIIRAISSAIQGTSYLRRILPVGVVVGSCLAALRKYFNVSTVHNDDQREGKTLDKIKTAQLHKNEASKKRRNSLNGSIAREADELKILKNGSIAREADELKILKRDTVMAGAFTAALGASALFVQQQGAHNGQKKIESASKPFKEQDHKLDDIVSDRNQNGIVANLAEKAMSVAGPVVPTKEDGGVDQERLVAMLADMGQRGGALKLVAKIALLWGGLRGATSLTNRLISFLHISERPLLQRMLAFSGMVLVLWSPFVVPLLPALMQGWTTNNPAKISELVCIIGLYTAILILVTLWGKRIRGYENPLEQYGLNLDPPSKVKSFFKGLIGGVSLVLFIQSLNALLGCTSFSWFPNHPLPVFDAMAWLKVFGTILALFGQGIITATVVAVVEELLFISWLPGEIAADFGYHQGIIISGLAFALFQRSPWAIPGLWLLSVALAGIREKHQGNLLIPVGFHAGIMATSFALQRSGFVTYKTNYATWVTGNYLWQPFSGVVGLGCSLLLAIILYPRKPQLRSDYRTRN